uniref:Protein dopey-1 n=1 Tax=Lygus hesperus TaxID=30085 RepID=A0A0A9ZDJ3_LYGHE
MEDQPHIMGNDIETMVCGLIACVQDSKVLVQRCALDLLILGFPLYNSHLTTDDMIRLVTAALSTILRRDQSLNRRMYAWLLGSEVNMTMLAHYPQLIKAKAESKPLTYFEVFSKNMLVKALKIILDNSIGVRPFDLKPYKLLISLLDKDGVGPAILDDILFEYFRLLYLTCNADPKVDTTEILEEANRLFGTIEPKFLWNYIGQLFSKACANHQSTNLDIENPVRRVASGDPGVVEICTLTEFLLDKVSTFDTSADTPSKHLPGLFLQVVTLLADHCNELTSMQIVKGLKLCAKILTRVQPVIVGHRNIGDDISDTDPSDSSIVNSVSYNQNDSVSSDFNQNTDSSSIDDKSELPHDDVELPSEKSDSLPEQCMRQYEKFYVTFMYTVRKRVGELRQVEFLLENLKVSSNKSSEERSKQFDNLLDDVLHCSRNGSPDEKEPSWSNPSGQEWVDPMKIASRLLVDLSTLKTFFRSPIPQSVLESESGFSRGDAIIESLPEWLRTLMTCTCWFNSSGHLQIVSINALLDLVTLCTTAQTLANNSTSDDGATSVLIVPLLTPVHLKYMEKNTFIFQVMSHWLWQQLGETEHKVQSVELLHQLHSVFPHNGIVESCIGQYLKSPSDKPSYDSRRLESFRKFAALWHIGREINSRQGNALRVSDIFYKSMLKMLDNLKLPGCNCLKIEAQEWLLHSLQRGDIHRILDPLLFMLLDPSTARLSVLHIRLSPEDTTSPQQVLSPTPDNRNVTAVSSVDGVITYHGGTKKENAKIKSDRFVSAVTTAIASPPVQHRQKLITDKRDDNSDPAKDKENNQSISLYVNPFSSVSSAINTDFDEFFEETDDASLKDSVKTEPLADGHRVIRNRSFPNLEKEVERKTFGVNEALKISSIDLLTSFGHYIDEGE